MIIYEYLRKLKRAYKQKQKEKAGLILSPVRRIERVYPPHNGKYVAMTFDDGPTYMKTNPVVSDYGLTEHILNTLEKYSAHGTFDVIGTTKNNYPDKKGKNGKFEWSGKRFDHYPDFEMDNDAGAVNCPELIEKIIKGAHQISNHGYRHILFGSKKLIYGNRHSFDNVYEAKDDIAKLHDLTENNFSYKITMSRPPHYVDKTKDGFSSYDIYRYMNYQYMAASFDGGGWIASDGNYENDVAKMVAPLERALKQDENALNGQIIFQKDGCNMSRQTPIASALEKQLEILTKYGYKVVTVDELLSLSPSADVATDCEYFEEFNSLVQKGYTVLRKNNCFYGEKTLTIYEFLTMIADPEELLGKYRDIFDSHFRNTDIFASYGISPKSPLAPAIALWAEKGFVSKDNSEKLTAKDILTWQFLNKFDKEAKGTSMYPLRKDVIVSMAKILLK